MLLRRAAVTLGICGSALLAQEPPSRVLLLDEEAESWLARCGKLRLVHLAGSLEERTSELGALCSGMIERNVERLAPEGERRAELASTWRERASTAERDSLERFAAGAGVPTPWLEALAALELAPPRLQLDGDPQWIDVPAGAEAVLVLDARGALRACWGGTLAGVAIEPLALRSSRAARLLERAKPGPFDVENDWRWSPAQPLRVEEGICEARPERRRAARSAEESAALARFPQERAAFPWRLSWRQRASLWSIADLDVPSGLASGSAVNDLVRARYFRGERADAAARPAFILLHHLQENFALEEAVARALAARGVDVVLVILPYYGPRHPPRRSLAHLMFGSGEEGLARVAAQTTSDVARVRDWLLAREDVSSVALGGISLGGILAALIGGVDGDWPRLAPLLAGGDLAAILAHDSREARGIRRELHKVGLELEDVLRTWTVLDPIAFAARADPRTVLLVNAREDEVIPRASTLALSEAFGGAPIEWFDGGHISVAKNLPAILERLARFLDG